MLNAFTAISLALSQVLIYLFTNIGGMVGMQAIFLARAVAARAAAWIMLGVAIASILALIIGTYAAGYVLINGISSLVPMPAYMSGAIGFITPKHFSTWVNVLIATYALGTAAAFLYRQILFVKEMWSLT